MKSKVWVGIISIGVLFIVLAGVPRVRETIQKWTKAFSKSDKEKDIYYCPMHPSYQSDRPGNCPICNMQLVRKESKLEKIAKAKEFCRLHNCPMVHDGKACPMLVFGAMGEAIQCPVCGQNIQESEKMSQKNDAHGDHEGHAMHPLPSGYNRVSMDDEKKEILGIQFQSVVMKDASKKIRSTGRLEVDETKRFHVHPKVEGWVGQIFARFEGDRVKKGDPLFSFYSPDFVAAQDEYLLALEILEGLPATAALLSRRLAESSVQSARERLLTWDISEEDVQRLERAKKSEKYLTLRSPIDGFVLTKHIYEGEYMERGGDFYHLVDLSVLWADVEVFEQDLSLIAEKEEALIHVSDGGQEDVRAAVKFISPLDRKSVV